MVAGDDEQDGAGHAALKYFSDVRRLPVLLHCMNQRMTRQQWMLTLANTGAGHDTAETVRRRHHQRGLQHYLGVNSVHELRALPLGLGGVAMRRNYVNTRTRALRLARDSVARHAEKNTCSGFSECGTETRCRGRL